MIFTCRLYLFFFFHRRQKERVELPRLVLHDRGMFRVLFLVLLRVGRELRRGLG